MTNDLMTTDTPMHESFSFSQIAWKRLRKNRGAMIGLLVIILATITGFFAYYIAPDSTPDADRQIVEIQARKPGHKQLFLKLTKEKNKARKKSIAIDPVKSLVSWFIHLLRVLIMEKMS